MHVMLQYNLGSNLLYKRFLLLTFKKKKKKKIQSYIYSMLFYFWLIEAITLITALLLDFVGHFELNNKSINQLVARQTRNI